MIYVVLLFLVFILCMPIGIKITKNDRNNDVDIFLSKIFNIRIDFDDFIRFLLTSRKDPNKITLSSVINNLKIGYEFRNLIKTVCNLGSVDSLTLIMKANFEDIHIQTYYYLSSNLFMIFFKEHLNNLFKKTDDLYFGIKDEYSTIKTFITLECLINIRLLHLIIALVKNYSDIPKIIKILRKSEYNE